MVDYVEIGQNVKMCRMRKRMKQAELAEMANVSAQHISHIECGITKLSLPPKSKSEPVQINLTPMLCVLCTIRKFSTKLRN